MLITLSSVQAANSIAICSTAKQGPVEGVLACPAGTTINIISAEYGRRIEDQETCCGKEIENIVPCYPSYPGEGGCIVDALDAPFIQSCQSK